MTTVTWACQPLPSGKSVYVVTPPDPALTWNTRTINRLTAACVPHVISSEACAGSDLPGLDRLITWERAAREIATVILYVVPSGSDPGADFGYDVALGRSVVLCVPHLEYAPRLLSLANTHSVPVRTKLTEAVGTAARWTRWGFPS